MCTIVLLIVIRHMSHLHEPIKYLGLLSVLSFTVAPITSTVVSVFKDKDQTLKSNGMERIIRASFTIIHLSSGIFGVFFYIHCLHYD